MSSCLPSKKRCNKKTFSPRGRGRGKEEEGEGRRKKASTQTQETRDGEARPWAGRLTQRQAPPPPFGLLPCLKHVPRRGKRGGEATRKTFSFFAFPLSSFIYYVFGLNSKVCRNDSGARQLAVLANRAAIHLRRSPKTGDDKTNQQCGHGLSAASSSPSPSSPPFSSTPSAAASGRAAPPL